MDSIYSNIYTKSSVMKKILLVLLFTLSLFAGESEEIGIPVINSQEEQIESAVLSPDGKSFYTLQGTYLIQWNLSPLKKLKEWQVPLKKITTGKEWNRFHDIWFLDNYTKILITSIEGMMIYNLKTHTVDKQVEYVSHSLVKDGDFLYLTHPTELDEPFSYRIDLEVWSIPELKRIKSINLTKLSYDYYNSFSKAMTVNGNLLVGDSVIFYFPSSTNKIMMKLDKSTLNFKGSGDAYSRVDVTLDGYIDAGRAIYKLSDGSKILDVTPESDKDFYIYAKKNNKVVIDSFQFDNKPSRSTVVGNLCLMRRGHRYVLLNVNKDKEKFIDCLAQYKREIIIQRYPEKIFETSSSNSQLLNMKTKDGKVTPMNEATFKKYNQPLNIKAN